LYADRKVPDAPIEEVAEIVDQRGHDRPDRPARVEGFARQFEAIPNTALESADGEELDELLVDGHRELKVRRRWNENREGLLIRGAPRRLGGEAPIFERPTPVQAVPDHGLLYAWTLGEVLAEAVKESPDIVFEG